jgi:LPS export ABC transporter protein LptC
MRKRDLVVLGIFSLLAGGTACSSDEVEQELEPFSGPLLEADSMQTLYSDSAVVRIMVKAPKQFEYQSGDQEFPEGIYIEFYEKDGSVSSTLVANHGYYFVEEDRYTGIGDVEVISLKDNKKLLTDTLHWSQPDEKVYTKANVTIIEEADTLRGQGLEAAQDFSSYTMLKPQGSTLLDEEEAQEDTDENN